MLEEYVNFFLFEYLKKMEVDFISANEQHIEKGSEMGLPLTLCPIV
jgi:hypothetical protein